MVLSMGIDANFRLRRYSDMSDSESAERYWASSNSVIRTTRSYRHRRTRRERYIESHQTRKWLEAIRVGVRS